MPNKQVSVRIEAGLWRRVRMEALARGVSAASAVEQGLIAWLSSGPEADQAAAMHRRYVDEHRQKYPSGKPETVKDLTYEQEG